MEERNVSKRQKVIALLVAAALILVCAGSFLAEQKARPQPDPAMAGWEEHTIYWFDVFNTVTRVVGYAPSQEEWTRQMDALHEDLLAYHKLYDIYNTYEGTTSLMDVNEQAGQGPVKADGETLAMLGLAKEMYGVTGGRLNVAMGSMLSIWHEYRTLGLSWPEQAALPPMEELKAAAAHMDIDDLILDEEAG
ncbi:MAG: FAD:protein FMN transferase, partial [Oscillospiraceae bacterium]|nr:FAD:protein FMN transferase [Oscillospiraceae bacterium]